MSAFFQSGPVLKNPFTSDSLLQTYLRFRLPEELSQSLTPELTAFGERVVGDVQRMGESAEAQVPKLVSFSPWGVRQDHIEVSEAWHQLHGVAATEGLVAIGYERKEGSWSRVKQMAKLFLFHPASAFYSCPLAMTDGAARAIELYGDETMKANAFANLTSRDPVRFWTSGQWMTEREGGSDVANTATEAKVSGDHFALFGEKWFTSATTSEMSLALARIEGDPSGSRGLSLFYVELRDASGRLKNIEIQRLKDKLGTKALPTAELRLLGTPAKLLGARGQGVRTVSAMLNITRTYNSVCSIATMARALALAKDYALKRSAFGKTLADQPLHIETLAQMQCEFEASFHLTFHLAFLLGLEECAKSTETQSQLLRILTPIVKLTTGKTAIAIASEVIECIGGVGYIEDSGFPRLLRDAQVFPIWEGTTNVLSLDVLRAMQKSEALEAFNADIRERLSQVKIERLLPSKEIAMNGLIEVGKYCQRMLNEDQDFAQAGVRSLALSMGRVFAASLLLEFAQYCDQQKERSHTVEVAIRYCEQKLITCSHHDAQVRHSALQMVFGE